MCFRLTVVAAGKGVLKRVGSRLKWTEISFPLALTHGESASFKNFGNLSIWGHYVIHILIQYGSNPKRDISNYWAWIVIV